MLLILWVCGVLFSSFMSARMCFVLQMYQVERKYVKVWSFPQWQHITEHCSYHKLSIVKGHCCLHSFLISHFSWNFCIVYSFFSVNPIVALIYLLHLFTCCIIHLLRVFCELPWAAMILHWCCSNFKWCDGLLRFSVEVNKEKYAYWILSQLLQP